MNLSIVFPRHWTSEDDVKSWVISKAVTAISNGLPRIETVPKSTENHNVKTYLSRDLLAIFAGKYPDASMSAFIVERAYAAYCEENKASKKTDYDGLRPEQKRLIKGMNEGIDREKIVFAEAGTGSGKTRAALISALNFIQKNNQPVVYAVPTLSILNHVVKEWGEVTPSISGVARPVRFSVVLGKRAFVDVRVLTSILEDPGEIPANVVEKAKTWMDQGGHWVLGSKTENLHNIASVKFLVEDLQAASPDFPAHECAISEASSDDDRGLAAYYTLRENALSSDIVVCTHAMLGIDALRQMRTNSGLARQLDDVRFSLDLARKENKPYTASKIEKKIKSLELSLEGVEPSESVSNRGVLPDFNLLIVDEAHQLESSLAGIRTSTLSPRILSKDIRKNLSLFVGIKQKTNALALSRELMRLHVAMSRFAMNEDKKTKKIRLKDVCKTYNILDILRKIKEIPRAKLVSAPVLRSELYSLNTILTNIESKFSEDVWVNLSPRRRYPSLYSGPYTLRPLLEKIWSRPSAACLVSATLSVNDSCYFMAEQLSVPSRRMHVLAPVIQPWLYSPSLKVHTESDLVRPSFEGEQEDIEAWYRAISSKIHALTLNANGGSLVLNSSYEIVSALADILLPQMGERLVVQSRDKNLGSSLLEFENKYRQNLRPVWLGAGSAWTGLDIMDKEVNAENDNFLTKLIITTLPFGTNQSTTHKVRVEKRIKFEFERAALELKQGLGRIMRRNHSQGRTIDILDPRVYAKKSHYAMFRVLLSKYQNQHS